VYIWGAAIRIRDFRGECGVADGAADDTYREESQVVACTSGCCGNDAIRVDEPWATAGRAERAFV
jgi:hypothetical protein